MIRSHTPAGPYSFQPVLPAAFLVLLRTFVLCLAVGLQPVAAVHAQQDEKAYDVLGGSLEDSLNAFASQAGITLSFDPALVQGRTAPPLKGTYSVDAGLKQLLAGTRLMPVINGSAVMIKPAPKSKTQGEALLPEVSVQASEDSLPGELPKPYAGGQVARGGRVGILGSRDYMETPFATQAFTRDFIDNVQATSLADVLKADPSVRDRTGVPRYNDYISFRGFPSSGNAATSLNGLYGLAGSTPRLEYIERVELLKGPSAFAAGVPGVVGGSLSLELKRAADEPITRVTGTYASDSVLGGAIDLGRRFGPDNSVGVRVNAGYEEGDTNIEDGRHRAHTAAIALDYRGERIRAFFDVIDEERNEHGYSYGLGLAAGVSLPSAPDSSKFMQPSWMSMTQATTLQMGRLEWDFAQDWTASLAYGQSEYEGPYTGYCYVVVLNTQGDVMCDAYANYGHREAKSGDFNIRGKLQTGVIGHQLVFGSSAVQTEYFFSSLPGGGFLDTYNYNIYNPVYGPAPAIPPRGDEPKGFQTRTNGLYFADTLSMWNERLLITLGGRHTTIKSQSFDSMTGSVTSSYDESKLTPVLAAVVRASSKISLYGNYVEALEEGGVAPSTAVNANQAFPPLVSKQIEGGIKLDYGQIGGTVSAFRIRKANQYLDVVTNVFTQDGLQENTGIEMTGFGEPVRGVRLVGGVAWIDAKLEKTDSGTLDGKTASGVPEFEARLTGEWDIPKILPGLTLTGSALHSSSAWYDDANTPTQKIPGWTRFDLGARYATKAGNTPLTLRLSVVNVADKDYWIADSGGFFTLSAPRTFFASVTADF